MSTILLMNNGYPTVHNPKHSSYIKNIKDGLVAAGHTVELCVLNSDFTGKAQHLLRYAGYYKNIFTKQFGSYDYVLINHYGHFALPLFRSIYKIKQPVIHWHGEDLFPKGKMAGRFFDRAVSKLPLHTRHITPSEYFRQQLAGKYNIPAARIAVSPSGGIDTDLFAPDKHTELEKKVIKLGFASGLSQEKGADMLVAVLQNITILEKRLQKKIELHYIVYGPEKKKYDALFRSYSGTTGRPVMSTAEMPEFYRSIDILLFPTLRKQESLGLVALEAMSCGKPVIGTDAFAVKEYIINGVSGERFIMNDQESFIEKIICAATHINKYTPENIIKEKYSKAAVVNFYKSFFC